MGVLTWMWDSTMLQIQDLVRKPSLSNMCWDSRLHILHSGGPAHIWLSHILPLEHLGNKPPTLAFLNGSRRKKEGRVGHHRDQASGGTRNSLLLITRTRTITNIKQEQAPGSCVLGQLTVGRRQRPLHFPSGPLPTEGLFRDSLT